MKYIQEAVPSWFDPHDPKATYAINTAFIFIHVLQGKICFLFSAGAATDGYRYLTLETDLVPGL